MLKPTSQENSSHSDERQCSTRFTAPSLALERDQSLLLLLSFSSGLATPPYLLSVSLVPFQSQECEEEGQQMQLGRQRSPNLHATAAVGLIDRLTLVDSCDCSLHLVLRQAAPVYGCSTESLVA